MADIAANTGMADAAGAAAAAERIPFLRRLSTKLLILTILFVMTAEVLIFPPTIANFRMQWFEQRLSTAAAISLVLLRADPGPLEDAAQEDVLRSVGAIAIAVREEGESQLLLAADMPPEVDEHVDLDNLGPVSAIGRAFDTLIFGGDRVLRVYGHVGDSEKQFELIIRDNDLRRAMLVYARNIVLLSLLISVFTAGLVFFTILQMMVHPIRRMRNSMRDFADQPDNPGRIIQPRARDDELGSAERGLSAMQSQLQRQLGEQKHLADLGLAVSKINHDMRNILASAQLMSDRLRAVHDPAVQAFAPKLVRTLDRAVSYSEDVLAYGRAQEAPPTRRLVRLHQLVEDVSELLGIEPDGPLEFINAVDPALEIDADADQLFRILNNLCRNAMQAMAADASSAVVSRLTVSAERMGTVCRITVSDTGPGLPEKARQNLFAAFRGSARSGGTGLGLAIAQELARAHGGTIELVESVGGRTVFAISIPDQPVRLDDVRPAMRNSG
ncbi:ATP-binding protein [Tianweitania sp.]|uniref:ATP-binding protein n=1 Tax=Tianweitania sp. TaxID=2021634 RepID=UPI003A0FEC01